MMPGLDGVQTLHRLHKDFPDLKTPVIALTADAVSGTEERLLGEGFAAYIAKPVGARKLEKVLAEHLPAELVTERTVYPGEWVSAEVKEAMSRDLSAAGVSLNDGLYSVGGDLSLLASVAEVFTKNYPDSLAQMKEAFPADELAYDLDRLRRLVHSLKSSAGFVGAGGLASTAERAERGCKSGDVEVIGLAMPLLYLEWERAQRGLKAFAAHVRAIEPRLERQSGARRFDPDKLAEYINRRIRRGAIAEIEALIAEKGRRGEFLEAKRMLRELDFDGAKRLLAESGVWE